MKALKKINFVIGVATIVSALMFTTSCQKEPSASPGSPSELKTQGNNIVIAPHTKDYIFLSKKLWQWALALPLAGHPFLDDPSFDVTEGQSGPPGF